MSTRGHSRPEPISQQTSTRSERTERPLTEHREPEIFETDTDTETEPEETEPEQLEIELDQTDEELAEELERLQMAESKETNRRERTPKNKQ
jgi:hypothetical protein